MKKNKNIFLVLIISFICLYFSTGKLGDIFIDVGREIYYPSAILDGKVLYKDLFCIYGPLSYLINALFFKIFGAKLSVLYALGIISAVSITGLIYKISRKFLSEFTCLTITFFVIITGCLSTRIFNYTLPYSYAALYGLLASLISIWFLINFIENKKAPFLIFSSIFGGLAFIFKYDFILYFLPLLIIILKTKDKNLILKSLTGFMLPPVLSFVPLFIQGLNFPDLNNAFKLIKDFTNTTSLHTFYVTQGVYYTNRIWSNWLEEILKLLFGFIFIFLGIILFYKNKIITKIFGTLFAIFGVFAVSFVANEGSYLYLTFLVSVLFILRFQKNNYVQNIFILSAVLISLKSFFGISHANYGIYYTGLILISFFILVQNNFNKYIEKSFCLLLIGLMINYFSLNIFDMKNSNFKIETKKGMLSTTSAWGKSANELVQYLENSTEETSSVMIFPEGLSLNFLSKRKANGFYSSLIPLYTEGFGEDKIISYYKENKPDYIVFSNLGSESYGKKEICDTYAQDFCSFVFENYKPIKKIENDETAFFIFMLK